MNKLEGKIVLENTVKVYVPSTVNVDKVMVDNSKFVDVALAEMSEAFGGATSQNGVGCWMSERLGLVKENVTIVYSYVDKLTDDTINKVVGLAEWIKAEMSQEAVAIEINGKGYLI